MGISGLNSVGGIGFEEPREVGSERDKEMMRRVFREIVDLPRTSTAASDDKPVDDSRQPQPRIILVSRATAMSSSFPTWWWALTQAVKTRNARGGQPTTIVLSLTPSFLHLGPNLSLPPPKPPVEAVDHSGLPPGLGELVKAMKRMREASSGAGGSGGQGGGKKEDEVWKGSEEDDKVGRKRRLRRRLACFQLGDEW